MSMSFFETRHACDSARWQWHVSECMQWQWHVSEGIQWQCGACSVQAMARSLKIIPSEEDVLIDDKRALPVREALP